MAGCRFHPDASVVLLDDPLADRETDTRTRDIATVQSFEDAEDLLCVFHMEADAIVGDTNDPLMPLQRRVDLDSGRIACAVLYGVGDQILEQLPELAGIGDDRWKINTDNLRLTIDDA